MNLDSPDIKDYCDMKEYYIVEHPASKYPVLICKNGDSWYIFGWSESIGDPDKILAGPFSINDILEWSKCELNQGEKEIYQ